MAAPATDAPSTFPLFSELPLELRNQIWRDALPDELESALFIYRRGCWLPRQLTPSEAGYDPDDSGDNLILEFNYRRLDRTPLRVPLAAVSHEARAAALVWARELGIEVVLDGDGDGREGVAGAGAAARPPVFLPGFDPARDVVYVSEGRLDDFFVEFYDRLDESDLQGRTLSVATHIRRVAFPAAVFAHDLNSIPEVLDLYPRVEAMYIIVDPPPDELTRPTAMRPREGNDAGAAGRRRRWELKSHGGGARGAEGAFLWNRQDRSFEYGGGEFLGDEALRKRVNELNGAFKEMFVGNDDCNREFRVETVLAVLG